MANCARCNSTRLWMSKQCGSCEDCGHTVMFGCIIDISQSYQYEDEEIPDSVHVDHEPIDVEFDGEQGKLYSLEEVDE